MMRRREAEAESVARFYMAGMLIGLLGLLLSCGYGVGLFHAPDDVEKLNAAIRTVESSRVTSLLQVLSAGKTNFSTEGRVHPLYALTCVEEDHTEEAQQMIHEVAKWFRTVPIDLDPARHPLTAAYRHRRYTVARAFIEGWQHPVPDADDEDAVMDEVHASALSAAELLKVDPRVNVYCRSSDAARCNVIAATRVRNASNSRLEAAHQRRYGRPSAPPRETPYRDSDMRPKIIAPSSTVRAALWDDPFHPVVPDLLPPRTAPVMNPGYFSSVLDQLAYVLLGYSEGSSTVEALAVFAVATSLVFFSTWCVGMTYWLVVSS
ncbi:hypothetical protein NESM_000669400 [Novymonas esmeraldas]|uniref:Uncharacterized protein n=1 Tax=Novymonas esmeraldas TaxID=1808958 RepID=A0AAW0EU02_9TRYP